MNLGSVFVRRCLAARGAFLLAACAIAVQGQPPAPPDSAATYHIVLITVKDCWDGDCLSQLTDKSLTVSQNGQSYPVHLTHEASSRMLSAGLAPHALVIVPPGARGQDNAGLAHSLSKLFDAGYQVSATRSDGSFTPYVTQEAELQDALGTVPANSTAVRSAGTIQSALDSLRNLPGKKIVLADVHRLPRRQQEEWATRLEGVGAQVYLIDGGEKKQIYYSSSWNAQTRAGLPPNEGDFLAKKARYLDDGIFHEVKLRSALRDITKDSRFNLDVSFNLPKSGPEFSSPITLKLGEATGLLPADLQSALYRESAAAEATGNRAPSWVPATQKLTIAAPWQ
jgi:hypothetical protein